MLWLLRMQGADDNILCYVADDIKYSCETPVLFVRFYAALSVQQYATLIIG